MAPIARRRAYCYAFYILVIFQRLRKAIKAIWSGIWSGAELA
jgi:hypothetical protein